MRLLPVLAPLVILLVAGLVVAGCTSEAESQAASYELPTVAVYKSPTCGCCAKWVEHLEENGFTVETHDVRSVAPTKERLGVPPGLVSCHTGVVNGYAVEGHVPADIIKRMLEEEPEMAGIAVPGMPIGSPGMEVEGRPAESYVVMAFGRDSSYVYARR